MTTKRKNWLIFLILVLLVTLIAFKGTDIQAYMQSDETEEQAQALKKQQKENKQLNNQVEQLNEEVKTLRNEKSEANDPNGNDEDKEEKNRNLVKDFALQWTNFESISERNEQVKQYLSDNAIDESGIEDTLNVEFESQGELEDIAKIHDEDKQRYIVFIDEDAQNEENTVLIDATVKNDTIDRFDARYVDSIAEEE